MTLPSTLRPKQKPAQQIQSQLPSSLRPKKIEQPKEGPSFLKKNIQEAVSSPSTQIALGLTQAATAPLDLFKMYAIGEALSGLDEIEEAHFRAGIPYDKEAEKKRILEQLQQLPTQSMAEEFIEKETGIETGSKDRFSKFLRGAAEFLGMASKGAKLPKLKPKSLGVEEQALRETAEKFGLRKFAGMEAEKPPALSPIVSAGREEKLAKKFGESSKKAVEDVISQKIPIKKMRESGVDLENAYTVAYDVAKTTAKDMGKQNIDFSNVIDWINQQIKRTKGTAPSLSKQDKIYVDILNSEKKNLLQPPKPKGSEIDLITGKAISPKPKEATATQAIKQFQNYNDNVKGIWKKPEFSGSENTVKNAYAGLNEQIINAIDKANPTLGNELKFANKVFHETSKLNQVEGILTKAFKDGYDPNKLSRILSNKRERQFLTRNIGKEGVQDLELIAKYGQQAEERVFKQLKNPTTAKEYLENITPGQLGLLFAYKGHVGALSYYIPKAIANRVQGWLFTRNSTRKAYVNFLKEAGELGKNPAPLFQASKHLQKAIEDEFGSEEELLNSAYREE